MFTAQVKAINKSNIKNVDEIIDSISAYLYEIQKHPTSLDPRNQAGNVIVWRNEFIACKRNLNTCITAIEVNYQRMLWVKTRSDEMFKEGQNFLKSLPGSTNRVLMLKNLKEIEQSSSSYDEILKQYGMMWATKYQTETKDLNLMLENIPNLIDEYNNWVQKTEVNQTGNFHAMGPLENLIRGIFQNNRMAQDLRSNVLSYRFESIKIDPSAYDDLKLIKNDLDT